MTCLECLRARQLVVHRVFGESCMGCEVRRIAYMSREAREQFFDRVQHLGGMGDRIEAIRLVTQERARIAALSAAMPKRERA